jgi:hypothetical protein
MIANLVQSVTTNWNESRRISSRGGGTDQTEEPSARRWGGGNNSDMAGLNLQAFYLLISPHRNNFCCSLCRPGSLMQPH